MVKKEIRCAIAGYGGAFSMGKYHADAINQTPGMTTYAVCDIEPARAEAAKADFAEIRTCTDYARLVADPEVDLVVIVTPHNTHAELALAAIKAGKHVVLEKPMCIRTAEATEMIEAAKKAGVTLTTFHNRRHDGDFMAIMDVINKGVIGEVFHAEYFMGDFRHPGHWWRSDKEVSGGAFYDWGAHIVDWVLHVIPEKMETIFGIYHKRLWNDVTNEDQVEAVIRFAGGKSADIQMSSIAAGKKPRWRILGTKGAIIDTDWKERFKLFAPIGGDCPMGGDLKSAPIGIGEVTVPYKKSTWEEWYPNLAHHLLEGAPLEVTPESSRRVIAVIETAEKSAKSGRSEPVPYE